MCKKFIDKINWQLVLSVFTLFVIIFQTIIFNDQKNIAKKQVEISNKQIIDYREKELIQTSREIESFLTKQKTCIVYRYSYLITLISPSSEKTNEDICKLDDSEREYFLIAGKMHNPEKDIYIRKIKDILDIRFSLEEDILNCRKNDCESNYISKRIKYYIENLSYI